jgi:hypothetical protein
VGETILLLSACDVQRAFYFTAARTSGEQNRRQLLVDRARWSGEPIEPDDHPTWHCVFGLLLDLRAPNAHFVVIDEFQYLADDERTLATVASELNVAWERRRAPRSILLLLAGSVVATMEALAGGGAWNANRTDVAVHFHHVAMLERAAMAGRG